MQRSLRESLGESLLDAVLPGSLAVVISSIDTAERGRGGLSGHTAPPILVVGSAVYEGREPVSGYLSLNVRTRSP